MCAKSMMSLPNADSVGPAVRPSTKRLVDLQDVDRQVAEIVERRVTGAEVVDGELDAEALELLEALTSGRSASLIMTSSVSSNTSDVRVQARALERTAHRLDDVGLEQLSGRQVHRDRERNAGMATVATAAPGGTRCRAPTLRSGRSRRVLTATSMNSPGASRPRVGCCQRTRASSPTSCPVSQRDDGLVVHGELSAVARDAESDVRARRG